MKKYKCRGFACMSKRRRSKIAKLGAIAIHENGTAYRFTTKAAKAASKKAAAARKKL